MSKRKYNFKFRLDAIAGENEFVTDSIAFLDIKNKTLAEIVNLLNLTMDTAEKVKISSFKKFDPSKEEQPL